MSGVGQSIGTGTLEFEEASHIVVMTGSGAAVSLDWPDERDHG